METDISEWKWLLIDVTWVYAQNCEKLAANSPFLKRHVKCHRCLNSRILLVSNRFFFKARFSHGKMIYMWVLQIGGYDSHRLNVYPKWFVDTFGRFRWPQKNPTPFTQWYPVAGVLKRIQKLEPILQNIHTWICNFGGYPIFHLNPLVNLVFSILHVHFKVISNLQLKLACKFVC